MRTIVNSDKHTTTVDQTAWPSEEYQDANIGTRLSVTSHINFVSCRYYSCFGDDLMKNN
jgi:hypothetical protein